MKKTVTNVLRCCAVAAVLLGGATASEASTITLTNGASSVDLCLPGAFCGPLGLSNWIADGGPVTWFSQWFTFSIESDPAGAISLGGPLEMLDSSPTITNQTASLVDVSFFNDLKKVGISIEFSLLEIAGVSHIHETATLDNKSSYYIDGGISDGMAMNGGAYIKAGSYIPQHGDLAEVDYTPNPEPMTMVLLGTGLLAAARSRRRNNTIA
jgi:hypothetical protein